MPQAHSFYEWHSFYEGLTWWFVRERIGLGLRERYEVPNKLPSELQALVRKIDTIEGGRYLLRYGLPLERRSVGESDWLPPSFVWQNDVDLFGG